MRFLTYDWSNSKRRQKKKKPAPLRNKVRNKDLFIILKKAHQHPLTNQPFYIYIVPHYPKGVHHHQTSKRKNTRKKSRHQQRSSVVIIITPWTGFNPFLTFFRGVLRVCFDD